MADNGGGLADVVGKEQAQMDNTTKGKNQPNNTGKGKAQMQDKDGFTLSRP